MRRPTQRSYGSQQPSRVDKRAQALGMIYARLDRGLPIEPGMLAAYSITGAAADRMIADAKASRERML